MPPPGPSENRHEPLLVGRADELSRLRSCADLAVETGAQTVLLGGDAGIGKSSLTLAFTRQLASEGWGVHTGHCIEYGDRPVPFGPIEHILRSLLLDNLENLDELVDTCRSELAALLPELREAGDSAASPADVDRLSGVISSLLVEASRRRPFAVLIEDVHWSDAATRDLLTALGHNLGTARVLILITARTGALDRGHPLRTWLAERRRFPNVHSIDLEGLSHDELAEQATEILGERPDEHFLDELLTRTGGNAYFAHELLTAHRAGVYALPESLAEFLTSRIEQRSDDERVVLRALAIADGMASHRTLEHMAHGIVVGPVIRSLFDGAIVIASGANYTFRHALLRDAILRDILPFEAEALHLLAAEALTVDLSLNPTPSGQASVAMHWHEGGDVTKSFTAALEAANGSAGIAAFDTASDLLLQALSVWDRLAAPEVLAGKQRDELVVQTADWLVIANRPLEAASLLSSALDQWGGGLADGRRALLHAKISAVLFRQTQTDEAARHLDDARALIANDVSAEAAQIHHIIARQAISDGRARAALDASNKAVEIAATKGPESVLIAAMTVKALATGALESASKGIPIAREARAKALAANYPSQVATAYRVEAQILNVQDGSPPIAIETLREALAYSERNCGPRNSEELRHDLALALIDSGLLDEAEPLLIELAKQPSPGMVEMYVHETGGLYALRRRSLDDAEHELGQSKALAESFQSAQETGFHSRLVAELARLRGHLDQALAHIDRALDLQLDNDNVSFTRESLLEKARIVAAILRSRPDHDPRLLAEIRGQADGFDHPGPASVAMRSATQLELDAIDRSDALDNAEDCFSQLHACGFFFEEALLRLLLIERHVGVVDNTELVSEVEAVRALAVDCGIAWMIDRADAIASAANIGIRGEGHAANTNPERAPFGLTEREVEVLSLLADGLTNKGIGERLYVSPRTVSTHVSNILAKLAVTNRAEAGAAFHRLQAEQIEIDVRDPSSVDS